MSKILVSLTDRHDEMLAELIAEKGYVNAQDVLRSGLVAMHTKMFPIYAKGTKSPETPEDKLKRKDAEKVAKENHAKKEYLEILEELGGTLEVDKKSGKEVAVYYTYNYDKKYEQRVPILMLSRDLIATQYAPSRKVVEKMLKGK